MHPYKFDPEWALQKIQCTTTCWRMSNIPSSTKWVLGISGGKDSSVVAAAFAKMYDKENVVGVLMPCNKQADIQDSYEVVKTLGIPYFEVNIGPAADHIRQEIVDTDIIHDLIDVDCNKSFVVADTNLPPRIRMSTLYYVAQAVGGIVLNTSNLSESMLGYGTLYGDIAGSFAPIRDLTCTEVIKLGEYLGLPDYMVHKVPADGLSGKTDEENLGVKYADVDNYIRLGPDAVTPETMELVDHKFNINKFKLETIHIPGVSFWEYPNFVTGDVPAWEYIKQLRRKSYNESSRIR